jgi:hypothetical protein
MPITTIYDENLMQLGAQVGQKQVMARESGRIRISKVAFCDLKQESRETP